VVRSQIVEDALDVPVWRLDFFGPMSCYLLPHDSRTDYHLSQYRKPWHFPQLSKALSMFRCGAQTFSGCCHVS
jgi:hypothetical protein